MNFANRLNSVLKKKKLSGYKLAKDLDVGMTTVRRWRKGITQPRDKALSRLSDYLEVSPVWLKFGDKDHAPKLKDEIMSKARQIEEYVRKHPEAWVKIKKIIDVLTEAL